MRHLFVFALALLLAIPAHAGDITWENDGADGWTSGDDWDTDNIDEIKEEVDDNDSRIDDAVAAMPLQVGPYVAGNDWGKAIEDALAAAPSLEQFVLQLDGDTTALNQVTAADLCNAPNETETGGFSLVGSGASWSRGRPTRLMPGSSMATGEFGTWTADFDVVANDSATDDSAGTSYDTITTPTDPRAAPYLLRRGDIIYVSGFTNANNNTAATAEKAVPLATNELPFRIHRVEWSGSMGKIVVVPFLGKDTNAGLTTESDSDNESIRKASYQLRVCGRQVKLDGIQFSGNAGNADIGVWFYGDNAPNLACQGSGDPYATVCTGYGTGTMSAITSIGSGIRNFATDGHNLAGVMFQPAANSSAQMDLAYAIDGESRDDFAGIIQNALQAKPAVFLDRLNLQNYRQFGVLHGSGRLTVLNSNFIASSSSDCPATDSGCWAIYSSHNNRIGFDLRGNAFEVTGGNGVYIEGAGTNSARFYTIVDNDFIANRSDSSGTERVRLLVADIAGSAVIQPNRFYSTNAGVTDDPEVTIGNGSEPSPGLELFASSVFGGSSTGTQPTGFNLEDGVVNLSDATPEIEAAVAAKSAASSTDNQIMRHDGTGGDVQGSACTISDTGVLDCGGTGATCLIFRDSDDAGDSACAVLNGTFSCETDTNGVCGDAT